MNSMNFWSIRTIRTIMIHTFEIIKILLNKKKRNLFIKISQIFDVYN